jgi:hypothetical protein
MLKRIAKAIVLMFVGLLIVNVGLWCGFHMFDYYKTRPLRELAKNLEQLQKERDLLYKNDLYGGKTPEETFDMYIAALKKGDLELASKYFVIDRQKEELSALKNMANRQLREYIDKINGMNTEWKLDEQLSSDENRVYWAAQRKISIQFNYNKSSGVWKIKLL